MSGVPVPDTTKAPQFVAEFRSQEALIMSVTEVMTFALLVTGCLTFYFVVQAAIVAVLHRRFDRR